MVNELTFSIIEPDVIMDDIIRTKEKLILRGIKDY